MSLHLKHLSIASLAAIVAAVLLVIASPSAHAATNTTGASTPYVLKEALSRRSNLNIYDDNKRSGFSVSGGFFTGRASGIDPTPSNYLNDNMGYGVSFDRNAELENDQRVYALLIDGKYDFNYGLGDLRPYMSGGLGMAMYDQASAPSASTLAQGGNMVPLVRIGGGVNYTLSEQLNLSLDYQAGFSGAGDNVFTGRNNQPVDLHIINMGMHYSF